MQEATKHSATFFEIAVYVTLSLWVNLRVYATLFGNANNIAQFRVMIMKNEQSILHVS
jgi:flagellar biosynthesis/type III secretory pathway M-ring protein FliF/YscJ